LADPQQQHMRFPAERFQCQCGVSPNLLPTASFRAMCAGAQSAADVPKDGMATSSYGGEDTW